jgi:hypothetical protein
VTRMGAWEFSPPPSTRCLLRLAKHWPYSSADVRARAPGARNQLQCAYRISAARLPAVRLSVPPDRLTRDVSSANRHGHLGGALSTKAAKNQQAEEHARMRC